MERLTIEYRGEYIPKELGSLTRFGDVDDWDLCYGHCKAREDDGVDCEGCAIRQCFNKLGEHEDLEESGKLLKNPQELKESILERMKKFMGEYRGYSESSIDHFGGKADSMETAMRIVKAAFSDAIEGEKHTMKETNVDRSREKQGQCEPEYLGENTAIGCRIGRCKCGNIVRSYHNFCNECGIKLEWGNVCKSNE